MALAAAKRQLPVGLGSQRQLLPAQRQWTLIHEAARPMSIRVRCEQHKGETKKQLRMLDRSTG
jgi:hypothetical protein